MVYLRISELRLHVWLSTMFSSRQGNASKDTRTWKD